MVASIGFFLSQHESDFFVLGSSINAQMSVSCLFYDVPSSDSFLRAQYGSPEDFDQWAEFIGDDSWSWKHLSR